MEGWDAHHRRHAHRATTIRAGSASAKAAPNSSSAAKPWPSAPTGAPTRTNSSSPRPHRRPRPLREDARPLPTANGTAPSDDLVVGFQLTHSGPLLQAHRYPSGSNRVSPSAIRSSTDRFNVTRDDQVFTDAELERLVEDFVAAARVAPRGRGRFRGHQALPRLPAPRIPRRPHPPRPLRRFLRKPHPASSATSSPASAPTATPSTSACG
jgi:hypothetical protein